MMFSFLHISDLHFDAELINKENYREKIKDKIKNDKLDADCLIISGDLFNRGKLSREGFERCNEFLRDLPGRRFTVVVPGNHDLDRSAQNAEDEAFNSFLTRKQLVLNKGEEAFSRGQYSLNGDEKRILYKNAYEAFFSFSKQMSFQSFMQENPPLEDNKYEFQVVQEKFRNFPCKVKFVLLNTGLIAGQAIGGDEYRKRKDYLKKELDKATSGGDYIKAAEVQVKLAKQQKRFEDDGELIIDEEGCQEDGPGRLSLSEDGLRALSSIRAERTELTIFVGHHGYQFLSSETKKALKRAMENSKSGLYLCGHAHQASYVRYKIGNNTVPKDIDQIQAGVMFKGESDYAQYGFDYGVFSVDEYNNIVCRVTSFFLVKSASGDFHWMSEALDISFNGISPPSTDEMEENKKPQDLNDSNTAEIAHSIFETPSLASGPASNKKLRDHFLNKQIKIDNEQNKKEEQ